MSRVQSIWESVQSPVAHQHYNDYSARVPDPILDHILNTYFIAHYHVSCHLVQMHYAVGILIFT